MVVANLPDTVDLQQLCETRQLPQGRQGGVLFVTSKGGKDLWCGVSYLKQARNSAAQRTMSDPSATLTPAQWLVKHCGHKGQEASLRREWPRHVTVLLPGFKPVKAAAVIKGLYAWAEQQQK